MRYTTVIWDFNGTILDDVSLCIQCANRLLSSRGLPMLSSADEYREKFCFPVSKYYEKLGFNFQVDPFDTLAHEWYEDYMSHEEILTVYPDFLPTWQAIHEAGMKQIILSSSEITALKRELCMLKIDSLFDAVIGIDNIYAGGKIDAAKRYFGASATGAVMIGDTAHDAETAHTIGADIVLLSCGHGAKETLIGTGAPCVDSLSDTLTYIL